MSLLLGVAVQPWPLILTGLWAPVQASLDPRRVGGLGPLPQTGAGGLNRPLALTLLESDGVLWCVVKGRAPTNHKGEVSDLFERH